MSSHAHLVKDFTEGSTEVPCPESPTPMNQDEVRFLIQMVVSEMVELGQTVFSVDEVRQIITDSVDKDLSADYVPPTDPIELMADQYDAPVDAWYYMLNLCGKKGANLCRIFDKVHESNMAKRDPSTGKFIRRESDGKVIKPEGWKPADIVAEIQDQVDNGAWH